MKAYNALDTELPVCCHCNTKERKNLRIIHWNIWECFLCGHVTIFDYHRFIKFRSIIHYRRMRYFNDEQAAKGICQQTSSR
jgi:hypothetical protein